MRRREKGHRTFRRHDNLRGVNVFRPRSRKADGDRLVRRSFRDELTREGAVWTKWTITGRAALTLDGQWPPEHVERGHHYIKNRSEFPPRIKAVAPETLERSLGKAKRVIRQVGPMG